MQKDDKNTNEEIENTENLNGNENSQTEESFQDLGIDPVSQTQLELVTDQFLKLQADFANYKVRADRDLKQNTFYEKRKIIGNILGIVDDLERIIKGTSLEEQSTRLFAGVSALLEKFYKTLESIGVKRFDSIGQEVDPNKHEVISQIPSEKKGIIDEFEAGYILGDEILRYAKVIYGDGSLGNSENI